ncbi:MAG: hypothetical protein LQ344_006204 [Seirophora lacunosa]|nr:MAG: hypothetical protein LQ344_006204 [Seirophora lacunosa]
MVSFLSHLNPTPGFPSYTGPYQVGTTDVEIPTSELPSPSSCPDSSLSTVNFRIFYPSESPVKHPSSVYWLPDPQQEYLGAYAQATVSLPSFGPEVHSSRLEAQLLTPADRNLPFLRILAYTTIPAVQNAKILQAPTKTRRWPVMVFSHGLGGTRNAYSHLLGSLSSHGVVVVAPEHRDGSAPLSCIHEKRGSPPRHVEYKYVSHRQSPEVEEARDEQLKIRLWELGLVHEALLKIDRGEPLTNLLSEESADSTGHLATFASSLDVHTAGSIAWAGHSFGAASIVQFVKSVFYHRAQSASPSHRLLFEPSSSSQVAHQITASSPVCLLDLWCLPLLSKHTRWLHDLPLPSYSSEGLGGRNIIAILSEAFFKWGNNLVELKRTISEDPSLDTASNKSHPAPHIFYPVSSAHLSQSDFGLLFPWLTKKALKAQDPARTLRLNTRAILEVMRRNGIEVAKTSSVDMEEAMSDGHVSDEPLGHDVSILKGDGSVTGWVALDLSSSRQVNEAANDISENADPTEAVVAGDLTKRTSG